MSVQIGYAASLFSGAIMTMLQRVKDPRVRIRRGTTRSSEQNAALLGDAFLRTPIEVQSFLSTRKESETEAILLLLGHMDHDCQSQNATT
jgi:hypothetical protein